MLASRRQAWTNALATELATDLPVSFSFVTVNGVTLHCARRARRTDRSSSSCTASRNSGSAGATISRRWPSAASRSSRRTSAATTCRASPKAPRPTGSARRRRRFRSGERARPRPVPRGRARLGRGRRLDDGGPRSEAPHERHHDPGAHPAVWLRAMRDDPEQRQKSRYVQILRMPWLSEMSLKAGNFAGLRRAFRSTRPRGLSARSARGLSRAPGAAGRADGHAELVSRALYREPATPEPAEPEGADARPMGRPGRVRRAETCRRERRALRQRAPPALPQATHWVIHDAPEVVRDALLDHL